MIKTQSKFMRGCVGAILLLSLVGCENLDENQQRMVSGGAIGVAAGAVGTVITGGCIACGMAIGGALGTAGGYLVGQLDSTTKSGPSASSSTNATYSGGPGPSASNDVPQGYPAGGYGNH